MDYSALASMAIVGAAVAGIVQYIKTKYGTGKKSMFIFIALSLVAGSVALFFQQHPTWLANIVTVIGSGNSVYLFLIKPREQ